MTNDEVGFVSKVSNVRTRTIDNKDYYVAKFNIPKDRLKKLQLSKGEDYVFARLTKAKWYHMVNWSKMATTWNMMPQSLKNEIINAGVNIPKETQFITKSIVSPTSPTSVNASAHTQESGRRTASGVTT